MLKRLTVTILAVLALAGCGDENPVGLDALVPVGTVRTVEVYLDAAAFLESDTSVVGYGRPATSGYLVIAEDAGQTLDTHGLVRFRPPPSSVTYQDSTGTTRVDTSPTFVGGEIVAVRDTTWARAGGPITLSVHRVAEAWDPATASWQMRVDSGGVTEPWTEPGGTRGALVQSANLYPEADTVVIPVDSATIALWSDTTDATRGALITSQPAGSRVRFNSIRLRLRARPSTQPDTVITDSVAVRAMTFVYDPRPQAGGALLVGGTPAWRSFLRLRERVDTMSVTVPCQADPQGCGYRLSDVTINYAALVLQPLPAPAGFEPGDSVRLDVRRVLGGGEIPLARAPIGESVSLPLTLPSSTFFPDAQPASTEIPITNAIRVLARKPEPSSGGADDSSQRPTLAMVDLSEGGRFGIASFASTVAGGDAPRLRIIISVASEDQVQ